MINSVRIFIWEHRDALPTAIKREHDISISLFNHGRLKPWGKVLFLVTSGSDLVCIVKTVYAKQYAYRLTKEYTMQSRASSLYHSIRAPQVYVSGEIDGRSFYAEEVCNFPSAPSRPGQDILQKVYVYQREQQKEGEITSLKIRELFNAYAPKAVLQKYGRYLESMSSSFGQAFTHGDLTTRNILIDPGGGLVVIDWERAAERTLWGIDLCHFITRVFGVETKDEFLAAFDHVTQMCGWELDRELFGDLYILDSGLDAIEKTDYAAYTELVKKLTENV